MNIYQSRIKKDPNGGYYAMCVYINQDGEEDMVITYRDRHFATLTAAEKSVSRFLEKLAIK